MSLSDIIIKIFEEHGSLSSREVLEIIKQNHKKYGIQRIPSYRNVQRYIGKYVEEGILKPEPPIGREQKYSLTTKEERKKQLQTYLIKRFWKEEEQIENEYLYGNPIRAYKKAVLLIMKLPEPYKQRLFEPLEQVITELNKINKLFVANEIGKMLKKREFLGKDGVPYLIEKIAEQLHKMQEETSHD